MRMPLRRALAASSIAVLGLVPGAETRARTLFEDEFSGASLDREY